MSETPYILRSGEALRPLGPLRLLADASTTGGRLTLYGGLLPVGGPPLHVHDFDEMLLVLEGGLIVQLDEQRSELGAGGFVWLAAGHSHTFANPGPAPVQAMGLAIPSGIEDLFAERSQYLAQLSTDELPDMERMAEIYAAHASRVLGPPIALD